MLDASCLLLSYRLASQESRQVRLEKRWSQYQTELHNIQNTKMRRNHSTWLTAKTVSKCFFFFYHFTQILKLKFSFAPPIHFHFLSRSLKGYKLSVSLVP